MVTHHRGMGQPLDRDDTPHGEESEVNTPHDYHHEDTVDFETIEQEHHTHLANITWELDDLCHRVQAGEGQPAESIHCIECKLQRLSIMLHLSALPDPTNDVLQHTQPLLSSAQKQTTFVNTLIPGHTYLQC